MPPYSRVRMAGLHPRAETPPGVHPRWWRYIFTLLNCSHYFRSSAFSVSLILVCVPWEVLLAPILIPTPSEHSDAEHLLCWVYILCRSCWGKTQLVATSSSLMSFSFASFPLWFLASKLLHVLSYEAILTVACCGVCIQQLPALVRCGYRGPLSKLWHSRPHDRCVPFKFMVSGSAINLWFLCF